MGRRILFLAILFAACGDDGDGAGQDGLPPGGDGQGAQGDGPSGPPPDGVRPPDGGGPGGDGAGLADAFIGPPADARPDAPPIGSCVPVSGEPALDLALVAGGFSSPVGVVAPPADRRLFVIEQHSGLIRIIDETGVVRGTPFLDLGADVSTGSEQGLLGLAFHPGYASNGRFFVSYTDTAGDTQVDEYQVSGDPNVADASSGTPIFSEPQPFTNHNGGHLAFGPGGLLTLGLGDGGDAYDPDENAQNPDTDLGKMLRIDVDGGGGVERWASGLRNPWRFSFDRETGDLYIGDVGQDDFEEISIAPAGSSGLNFGWDIVEGATGPCYNPSCDPTGTTLPVHEFPSGVVIGGTVYRGCRMPDLHGRYFFADHYGLAFGVRSFVWDGGSGITDLRNHDALNPGVVSAFGEDADGELLVVDYGAGMIYRVVPI